MRSGSERERERRERAFLFALAARIESERIEKWRTVERVNKRLPLHYSQPSKLYHPLSEQLINLTSPNKSTGEAHNLTFKKPTINKAIEMDILPDDAPAPRLCHLIKWPDFDGYGFNLHAERSNPGQFIGKIDDESPAQMAGLREGDRIVEVNGVNISNENHRQVVERIKSDPQEARLLVVDPDTDLWYREQDLVVKSNQVNVVYMRTPTPRPKPDSPRANFYRQSEDQSSDDHQIIVANSASLSPSTNGGASSLETSDFNDDSIEQQQVASSKTTQDQRTGTPPMSPDSGKGDEEPPVVPNQSEIVIEAEINRQSPVKPNLISVSQNNDTDSKQTVAQDTNTTASAESEQLQPEEQEEETFNKQSANELQPDSLSQAESSASPLPTNATQVSKLLPVCPSTSPSFSCTCSVPRGFNFYEQLYSIYRYCWFFTNLQRLLFDTILCFKLHGPNRSTALSACGAKLRCSYLRLLARVQPFRQDDGDHST